MREFIDPYSNEDTELKLLNSKGMDENTILNQYKIILENSRDNFW